MIVNSGASGGSGGLKIIAEGSNSYGANFSKAARILIVSVKLDSGGLETYMLFPGDVTSEDYGRYDTWVLFASDGKSFSSLAGDDASELPCSYVALG